MAQVSYGTITITDTNDIEKIYMEYAQSQNNQTAPTTGWDDDIPTWREGYYIWQRTVTKMSGVPLSQDSYGEPVCLTGSTGSSGAPGQSVDSIVTSYCNYGTGTPAATYSGWQSAVPAYDSTKPNYWIKTVITYSNPTTTDTKIYKDNGITSATSTAAAANTTAQNAKDKADDAWDKADNAETIAGNANTAISDLNQYFWRKKSASTNVPAGSYVTNIPGTTYQQDPANGGFNSLVQANGIFLRNGIATLSSWTGDALTFYHPTNSGQGNRGMELSSSTLKFYDSTGTVAQATFGGTQATVSGTINVYDGKIGNASNYWYIGNYTDYNQNDSAIIKSIGTASIQLNETNTWRIATNRIHTAWAPATGTDAYKLHFPIYVDSENTNRHWDYGLHLPTSYSDKFLYIRNAASSETLDNLLDDLDDAGYDYWNYIFYIDGSGNLHAGDIYSHGTLISGTSAPYLLKSGGTMTGNITMSNGAKLIGDVTGNVSGSAGKLSNTSKIGDTNKPVYFSASGVPVAISYEINKSVPSNAIFTDQNVRSTQANTTKLWLVGTPTSGDRTGELNYDSNIYADTTAGALHATTFNGYTLAAASAKGVDTSLTTSTTSTNLPTSAAVVNLIKQYLPLTGGSVTGAVTFGDSVSVDELTVGDLVVNGSASFTNNLQANTINGIVVGNNPKFTDTVTTVTVTGSGNAITSMTASNGAITATKGSTFLTSETDPIFVASAAHGITSNDISNWNSKTSNIGTVTSVRVQASSPLQSSVSTTQNESLNTTISFTNQNANTVLAGPASGSTAAAPTFRALVAADIPDLSGTYYLASNPNNYTANEGTVTSVKVQGSNGLTGSGTVTTSGTITISHATGTGSSSSNSGRTYIQSITLDTYGHVTGISTATETVTDTHHTAYLYNGSAASGSNATANKAVTTGNVYLNLVENGSIRNSHKLIAANGLTITSNTSGDITFTSPDAFISVEAVNTGTEQNPTYVLRFTKSGGGTTDVSTANIAVIQSEGANKLVTAGTTTGIDVTGPVKFVAGIPVTMSAANGDSIPSSLISGTISPSSHTHGNITNGGEITSTVVTVSNNDTLLFADSSNNGKIERLAVFDGSTTTQFLSKKGTWETPVGSVTGVKGNSESSYHTGNVNLTAANIGAATSGHTHTTTLAAAASGDTSQLTLAYNTKYKLTAGGTDYIFTMPASDNTDTHRPIQLKGTEILGNNTTALNFAEGNNITLSNSGGTITINSSYTNTDEKIKLSVVSTETGTYPLMLAPTGTLTSGNTYQGYYNTGITVTPNTKTITATTFAGNASSATEFSSGTTVKLTGNVTGESSSSKKGWTISTTIGNGVVTNAMLAGSIANGKLTNSSITIGSKTINLGDTVTLAEIGAGTSNLTLGTTSTTAYRGDYGNTAYTHATDSGRLTTAKSSAFYKFSVTAHGHVGSVTAVTGSDISGLLSFGTAYNSSSNKIATISDVTSAIDGATNKYVTIATDQTITASQKTFNGATRWSVTNSATGSKYGACNYDATLDALVFSFGTI